MAALGALEHPTWHWRTVPVTASKPEAPPGAYSVSLVSKRQYPTSRIYAYDIVEEWPLPLPFDFDEQPSTRKVASRVEHCYSYFFL
jgi:hypothetical protein